MMMTMVMIMVMLLEAIVEEFLDLEGCNLTEADMLKNREQMVDCD